MSSYPDRCTLKLERRTLNDEDDASVTRELTAVLDRLHHADPEFEGSLRALFSRPAYAIPSSHALVTALRKAMPLAMDADVVGMSFWTDAAVLGAAGIPSLLFGPGGAGLHSREEYVEIGDVLRCRDGLAALARGWCSPT